MGCIKLTHVQANGHKLILSLRTPHEAVDPSAITPGEHRMTAQAMVECRLLSWSISALDLLFASYFQLSKTFHALITRDLARVQERYCELTTDHVDRRLACALIRLTQRIGSKAETAVYGCRYHVRNWRKWWELRSSPLAG